MKRHFLQILFFCLPILMFGQSQDKLTIAQEYIKGQAIELGLTQNDIENMVVTDHYVSKHNGLTHIYLDQTHNGIRINNANVNLNITKEGEVVYSRNQFYKNVKKLVNNTEYSLSPDQAVRSAAIDLEIDFTKSLEIKEAISKHKFRFAESDISDKEILAEAKYQENEDGELVLVWNFKIDNPSNLDYWDYNVDANTGAIINKINNTLYCRTKHAKSAGAHEHHNCSHTHQANQAEEAATSVSGTYNAYIFPAESPIHGVQSMTTEPHLVEASPLGWHDDDGIEGADYEYTKGNNVHAFTDLDGDNFSDGDEPNGGPALVFDFPHVVDEEADTNHDAATVNLFYSFSALHDLTYVFGWDEQGGNCQFNNYGADGQPFDHFIAKEADPNIANNAGVQVTADGISPIVSMGIWTAGDNVLEVNFPEDVAGPVDVQEPTGAADGSWGILWSLDDINVAGDLAVAFDDHIQFPLQCCGEIQNEEEVKDKIALIDRGTCEFGTKALNAQNAGAIAAIICNIPGVNGGTGEELVNMNGATDGPDVNIPAVFAPYSWCERMKVKLAEGGVVSVTISNSFEVEPPTTFSSSFDNVVIAHEMGHVLNGRLLGGPNSAAGLGNAEQMGEGWSDFIGIAFTTEEGDTGEDPRGVGTYLLKESPEGVGIRRYPYSRDMAISPYTYNDIVGINEAHGIGEVWAAMIWDLYWNFVDIYGFDVTWKDNTSGNWIATQMIMDGLKIVGTNPGFADARDAILVADQVNNAGAHQCMIWETFARRGLGYDADQGSPNDSNDGSEGYEPLPTCIQELKITKSGTDFIEPGDVVNVTILVQNHTLEAANGVIVTDEIPEGLTLMNPSITPTVNGGMMSFDLGDMASLDEITITYELASDPNNKSARLVYDDIEELNSSWIVDFIGAEGFNLWSRSQLETNSGDFSWYVEEVDDDSRQSLIYTGLEVVGDNPVLRFWHKYFTIAGTDGGYIEISTDAGDTWSIVKDEFIRNGYDRPLGYTTFAIPSLFAYSGDSGDDFIDAYIDLSKYQGQTISVKFRFGTDGTDTAVVDGNFPGWFVDDFELLDLIKHTSTACVNATNLDESCSDEMVTLVNTGEISSLSEANVEGFEVSIFPNPASDYVTLSMNTERTGQYGLRISTIDGRDVYSTPLIIDRVSQQIKIDTKAYAPGFYILSLETNEGIITRKLVIE